MGSPGQVCSFQGFPGSSLSLGYSVTGDLFSLFPLGHLYVIIIYSLRWLNRGDFSFIPSGGEQHVMVAKLDK